MGSRVRCVSLGLKGGNHLSPLELNYLISSAGSQAPCLLPEYSSKNDKDRLADLEFACIFPL